MSCEKLRRVSVSITLFVFSINGLKKMQGHFWHHFLIQGRPIEVRIFYYYFLSWRLWLLFIMYLYGQIQSTKKPGIMTNYGYVKQKYFCGVYRVDRTGIGYCDKDNIYKVNWREVKEIFRSVVFIFLQTCHSVHVPVSTQVSITIRVVGQSSFHRLAFLRIAGPPCLQGFFWWPARYRSP